MNNEELPLCRATRSFWEIVEPWLEESDATERGCRDLSWQERFIFLSDYAGHVREHGTISLEKFKEIWRQQQKTAIPPLLWRGALLIGGGSGRQTA